MAPPATQQPAAAPGQDKYSGGWSGESTGYYSGTPLWFQQGGRHALSTYRVAHSLCYSPSLVQSP